MRTMRSSEMHHVDCEQKSSLACILSPSLTMTATYVVSGLYVTVWAGTCCSGKVEMGWNWDQKESADEKSDTREISVWSLVQAATTCHSSSSNLQNESFPPSSMNHGGRKQGIAVLRRAGSCGASAQSFASQCTDFRDHGSRHAGETRLQIAHASIATAVNSTWHVASLRDRQAHTACEQAGHLPRRVQVCAKL